ncbi:hypothetical protein BHE74_00052724 [Ensete ventricosum]|nr:hypothetical protein GW17_00044109 [Ensete ventricosum]RWW41769.1 hypothetical protein BHE74_00052724 [Ensete ventricosum]RZS25368.1 hypothetical protein BHM03_00058559 [Ensete ventricosum]
MVPSISIHGCLMFTGALSDWPMHWVKMSPGLFALLLILYVTGYEAVLTRTSLGEIGIGGRQMSYPWFIVLSWVGVLGLLYHGDSGL